jgi:hypothetical protein
MTTCAIHLPRVGPQEVTGDQTSFQRDDIPHPAPVFTRCRGWSCWISGLTSGVAQAHGRSRTARGAERSDDLGRARDHRTHLV